MPPTDDIDKLFAVDKDDSPWYGVLAYRSSDGLVPAKTKFVSSIHPTKPKAHGYFVSRVNENDYVAIDGLFVSFN
jgi:hypothetical protein